MEKSPKTIHHLLEWQVGKFNKNEEYPLDVDFLIVDECSMLDINLTASLLKAVPDNSQLLFIGDADQLPSVGVANVLRDIIASEKAPCFRLTKIFRQAQESLIIHYTHQINNGKMPYIDSPFKRPEIWKNGADCLFLDSDEATQEQMGFIARVNKYYDPKAAEKDVSESDSNLYEFRTSEPLIPFKTELTIPKKFQHVDISRIIAAQTSIEELLAVLKKIHPWSSLHFGLAASDVVRKLYLEWIPKYSGTGLSLCHYNP